LRGNSFTIQAFLEEAEKLNSGILRAA